MESLTSSVPSKNVNGTVSPLSHLLLRSILLKGDGGDDLVGEYDRLRGHNPSDPATKDIFNGDPELEFTGEEPTLQPVIWFILWNPCNELDLDNVGIEPPPPRRDFLLVGLLLLVGDFVGDLPRPYLIEIGDSLRDNTFLSGESLGVFIVNNWDIGFHFLWDVCIVVFVRFKVLCLHFKEFSPYLIQIEIIVDISMRLN